MAFRREVFAITSHTKVQARIFLPEPRQGKGPKRQKQWWPSSSIRTLSGWSTRWRRIWPCLPLCTSQCSLRPPCGGRCDCDFHRSTLPNLADVRFSAHGLSGHPSHLVKSFGRHGSQLRGLRTSSPRVLVGSFRLQGIMAAELDAQAYLRFRVGGWWPYIVHNTTCCTPHLLSLFCVITTRHTSWKECVVCKLSQNEYRVMCVLRKILTSIHVSPTVFVVSLWSPRCSLSHFSDPFTSDAISTNNIDAFKPATRHSAWWSCVLALLPTWPPTQVMSPSVTSTTTRRSRR